MKLYTTELPKQTEEESRECRDCHEVKPAEKFKKVPSGHRSGVCAACSTRKRNKTVGANNAEMRLEALADAGIDEGTTDAKIQAELWKNYRKSKSTAERIRCLEALVKLRPQDQKTALDDSAVVASLMQALKAKKKEPDPAP